MKRQFKHIPTGDIYTQGTPGLAYDNKIFCKNEESVSLKVATTGNDWIEITETEYTILSFYDGFNVYNKYSTGFSINMRYFYSEEDLLKKLTNQIYSVLRKSDGEIFTVGDNYNLGTIKSIELKDNTPIFHNGNGSSSGLKVTVKSKPVLFTTEDNVDIFDENLEVYSVLTKSGWDQRITTYGGYGKALNGTAFTTDSPWKHFYSKSAREEYILLNKPCLSLNDFIKLKENHKYSIGAMQTTSYINQLKELVISKQSKIK